MNFLKLYLNGVVWEMSLRRERIIHCFLRKTFNLKHGMCCTDYGIQRLHVLFFRLFDEMSLFNGRVPSTGTLKGQEAKDYIQQQTYIVKNE